MEQLFKALTPLILILLLQACASSPKIDQIAEGEVQVLTVPSNTVKFTKIDVHQHGDKTEIQVVVHPIKPVIKFQSGELLLTITDTNGHEQTILIDKASKDMHSPGHKLQHSHFITFLPYQLPAGSKIQVEHKASGTQ